MPENSRLQNSTSPAASAPPASRPRLVALTGATGYVGGRLLERFEQQGQPVRCLARRPEYLEGRVATTTEVALGDVLEESTLAPALAGADVAYYLIHSMGGGPDFAAREKQSAENFARAARAAGVKRIIYLGGLGDSDRPLSEHLESRQKVGQLLHSAGTEVIEFRSSIVIGSGSLSFELIRALVERLPVMITPRWVSIACQPIAVADLLQYLAEALALKPAEGHRIFEIGGGEVSTYAGIMREYARQRNLTRVMIPVPVLTPYLSSLWLGLVTPLFAPVGRILVESIKNPTVVRDRDADTSFSVRPVGLSEAVAAALRHEERAFARSRWSDALSVVEGRTRSWGGVRLGNRVVDSRTIKVSAAPPAAFTPVRRIGGKRGWYFANILWRLRGYMDLLIGGVGMRRGRRDPEMLHVGDVVDCWRVEKVEPDRRLRLQAEMRLPGRAWLEFEVEPDGTGSVIRQTAVFDPAGLWGLTYWYMLYPIHHVLFGGMLKNIAREARKAANSEAMPATADVSARAGETPSR